MEPIFHIIEATEWTAANEVGEYSPTSLACDGFIHFSYRHQVAATANRFYPDRDGLIVVEVDPRRLSLPVVVEDLYSAGQGFPHVYGPIPTAAAVTTHPLPKGPSGYSFG